MQPLLDDVLEGFNLEHRAPVGTRAYEDAPVEARAKQKATKKR